MITDERLDEYERAAQYLCSKAIRELIAEIRRLRGNAPVNIDPLAGTPDGLVS